MSDPFFTVLIDNQPARFEKNRILTIEPYEFGTKIIMQASHSEEEPFVYLTNEPFEDVMRSYSS